jgi:hypothetical protein
LARSDEVRRRGSDAAAGSLFSYVDLEKRVHADHPLRVIRSVVNATLADLSAAFDALYSPFGRESIPPERLLRALLLQALFDPVGAAVGRADRVRPAVPLVRRPRGR